MTIDIVAPIAGAVVGVYHLVRSVVRYRRDAADAFELGESVGAALIAPFVGWQLMGLGLVAAIGYPLVLAGLSGLVHHGQRRAALLEAGTPNRERLSP